MSGADHRHYLDYCPDCAPAIERELKALAAEREPSVYEDPAVLGAIAEFTGTHVGHAPRWPFDQRSQNDLNTWDDFGR